MALGWQASGWSLQTCPKDMRRPDKNTAWQENKMCSDSLSFPVFPKQLWMKVNSWIHVIKEQIVVRATFSRVPTGRLWTWGGSNLELFGLESNKSYVCLSAVWIRSASVEWHRSWKEGLHGDQETGAGHLGPDQEAPPAARRPDDGHCSWGTPPPPPLLCCEPGSDC